MRHRHFLRYFRLLLTGDIAHNIANGHISVSSFYERRIMRISPALVTMLAASTVLAYFVLSSSLSSSAVNRFWRALFSYVEEQL